MILPPRTGANANGARVGAPASSDLTPKAARREEGPPSAAAGSHPDPHNQ
jgi:hypothetical protein